MSNAASPFAPSPFTRSQVKVGPGHVWEPCFACGSYVSAASALTFAFSDIFDMSREIKMFDKFTERAKTRQKSPQNSLGLSFRIRTKTTNNKKHKQKQTLKNNKKTKRNNIKKHRKKRKKNINKKDATKKDTTNSHKNDKQQEK